MDVHQTVVDLHWDSSHLPEEQVCPQSRTESGRKNRETCRAALYGAKTVYCLDTQTLLLEILNGL